MKMNSLLKLVLIVLALLLSVFIALYLLRALYARPLCMICLKSHVIHDYFQATGIYKKCMDDDPQKTINLYGKPRLIETKERKDGDYLCYYYYDDFAIVFWTTDNTIFRFYGFYITSPKITIRHDIRVGSTKQQIINAYKKCPSMKYAEKNGYQYGEYVCDNGYRNDTRNELVFVYDESDKVIGILYHP